MKIGGALSFCFGSIRKSNGFQFMLVVYFLAQVSISGLASFVVPFFSNKVFSSTTSLSSLLIWSGIWLLFALLSSIVDYNGNKYNLRTYYGIGESQFKGHFSRVLGTSFDSLMRFSSEVVVSRLNEDLENVANIVLWFVGIIAMGFSCLVVLLWSVSLCTSVFLVLFSSCLVSVISKRFADCKVSIYRDLRIKAEQNLSILHSVVNQDDVFMSVVFLEKAFSSERRRLYSDLRMQMKKESFWIWIGDSSLTLIDSFSRILCILILFRANMGDASIVIPLFTLQSTYQNQLMTLLGNASSIASNVHSVTRVLELEDEGACRRYSTFEEQLDCVVHARGVSVVTQGGRRILDDVSLEVKRGEKVSIVGRNGSGKTTLIRTLMGLVQMSSGNVIVPKRVGYSPVSFQFYEMSLIDNCSLVRGSDPLDFLYSESIGTFPLQEEVVLSRNVCNLSEGQRQEASLFRAVNGSSLLVLDEPTHCLNSKNAAMLMDYVMSLPCAVIFITHDSRLASKADVVYEIRDGRLDIVES